MNITPKQEAFAQKYIECGNASEAYRHAYDVGADTSEWVKVEASNQSRQLGETYRLLRL